MSKKDGKFIVKKITPFKDLLGGKITELPESDLCFQNENGIIQLTYENEETDTKLEVKPGLHLLTMTQQGIKPTATELQKRELLTSITNTTKIIHEAKTFFSKLHVYEKLQRPKKRGVLLYSDPGMGKSAAITEFCNTAMKEDKGTVVFIWPTTEIDASTMSKFLSINSKFTDKCTRLVLVMEDIGGDEREGSGSARAVDAAMLNLLDGLEVTFKLPTFIIATTNYPQNLLGALADRPGRFDLMVKLNPPTADERVALVEFMAKRDEPLTAEEEKAIRDKKCEKFSIAHLEEVVVRSLLHDKTLGEVIDELVAHSELVKQDFTENKGSSVGFGR